MKRKLPYWMHRRLSCPFCGYLVPYSDEPINKNFDCPRCDNHLTSDEFLDINHDKYSYKADLSLEIEE